MRGLALEGGGARGAYHIGVAKAFFENGCEFDGYVGTSIGAINAAILAQGDFQRLLELWENISMERLFDEEQLQLVRLINPDELKNGAKLSAGIKKALAKIFEARGVDTSKMRALLEDYIDERRLREYGKDFGLVTVSINERKPYELMLEDIPEGSLVSYIMASASFPGFQHETIDENTFFDGGIYNNCPFNLLQARGYGEIIAVRTSAPGVFRKVSGPAEVTIISAKESLGGMMRFSPENSAAKIRLGYYDGLRSIKNLLGREYYVSPVAESEIYAMLSALDEQVILGAGGILGAPELPARRMLFEHIIPQLGAYLRLEKGFDYTDFAIGLLEHLAAGRGVERFKVYGFEELCGLVGSAGPPPKEKALLGLVPGRGLLTRKKMAVDFLAEALLM